MNNNSFYGWALMLFACLTALIYSNISSAWLSVMIGSAVKGVGKAEGGLAMMLCLLALAYYVVRELYVRLLVKKKMLPSLLKSPWPVKIITWLRKYHPYFGLLALVVAMMHGYLLWGVWVKFTVVGRVSTGITACLLFIGLFISGVVLKTVRSKRMVWGRVHMAIAVIFLLAALLHVETKIALYSLL